MATPTQIALPGHAASSYRPVHTMEPQSLCPLGMALLRKQGMPVRSASLGQFAVLDDQLLISLLYFVDGADLIRLSATSRYMCAFCNAVELWRARLVLDCGSDWTWQRTYKRSWVAAKLGLAAWTAKAGAAVASVSPSVLARGAPVASDLLYAAQRCAAQPLASDWLQGDWVPQASGHGLTQADFVSKYDERRVPVVLRGAAAAWPAYQKWTLDWLHSQLGDVKCVAGHFHMALGTFIKYCRDVGAWSAAVDAGTVQAARQRALAARVGGKRSRSGSACSEGSVEDGGPAVLDDQPLYMFDRDFALRAPCLVEDYSLPAAFPADMFACLGEHRPHWRWLILGPARSGSTFHVDPNATSAWNAAIRGSKRWVMYPPSMPPPGVHATPDGSSVAVPMAVTEWWDGFYEHHVNQRKAALRAAAAAAHAAGQASLAADEHALAGSEFYHGPLEFTQQAGDVVFVPSGWWHTVLNLEQPTIAITHNFVTPANADAVLQFLKRKPDQVSGVPHADAPQLYGKFAAALQAHYPEVWDSVQVAEEARAAKRGAVTMQQRWADVKTGPAAGEQQLGASSSSFSFGFQL